MKAIQTKFLGPGSLRGSRVKAWDHAGNQVTIAWEPKEDGEWNHRHAVEALCLKLKIPIGKIYSGELKDSLVHIIQRKKEKWLV